jgi:hypothetical protein
MKEALLTLTLPVYSLPEVLIFNLGIYMSFTKTMSQSKSILAFAITSVLALSGCNSSDEESNQSTARFSLGISDAPVDNATHVFIEIDAISLSKKDEESGSTEWRIESFDIDGQMEETVKVNLLDYQGSSQLVIVDESQQIEVDLGEYDMELEVVDSGSYVLLDNDATEHAIKVPSGRLKLGDFTVTDAAVQVNDEPAYTIEFDLRKSLVLRGNANNNNGFIIKPHGVRIVSLAGSIEGTISADLTNLGQCVVYLYADDVTEFGDMYDADDENFVMPENSITATAPLATTVVADNGSYEIGFVQAADYQVALTCGTQSDDNVQFDGLTIPSASDLTPEVVTITVEQQQATTVNF